MVTIFFFIILLFLTVYSYSQIDLNLTLSSNSTYQAIQYQLIQLGYYNRPASAYLFIGILTGLFLLYWHMLHLASKGNISFNSVRYIIAVSVVLGIFSYPAFSHDIFNYMFDARIVTTYGQNPYLSSAQDFPADLWVRFMHWTHRTYPYGPLWLVLTIPISFMGMGKFVITLLLYKMMFATFHMGNVWLIGRISTTLKSKHALLAMVIYGMNPLVIIESLVSPHNEVVMAFFLLLSLYYLVVAKLASRGSTNLNVLSIVMLMVSGAIKFITWILLPVFLFHKQITKRWGNDRFLFLTIITLLIPLGYVMWQREPYSWYLLPLLALAALLSHYSWIRILASGVSLSLLLRYAPFLYFGDYTAQMRMWQNGTFFFSLFVTALAGAWFLMKKPRSKTRAY